MVYICCCFCNLLFIVWGMSVYLIVNFGYDVDQVKEKVEEWFVLMIEGSYLGDVCYIGGCMKGFLNNGCGGMSLYQFKI